MTLSPWLVRQIQPSQHEWQLVFQTPLPVSPNSYFSYNPKMFGVTLSNWFSAQQTADCEAFFSTELSVTRCSTSSHLRLNNALSHCWGLEEADGCFTAQWEEIIPQNVKHNRQYLYYSQNRFVGLSQRCTELHFLLQELNLKDVNLM